MAKSLIKYFVLSIGVGTLLFAFQNCGAPVEEEASIDESSSSVKDFGSASVTYNLDGTVSFPMPGSGSLSGSGSGGGGSGTIDLGGGGSGGSGSGVGGSGGSGGGSGGWTPGEYDPYKNNFRTSSLYPSNPGGTTGFSKHRYSFEAVNSLKDGKLLWNSYNRAIASWTDQQMGTQERKKLIVIALKKLSEGGGKTTYGLTGTSLCYNFSGTLTTPTALTNYSYTYWTGSTDGERTERFNGYQSTLSAININRKTEEQLTMLESSGCSALAGYDKRALDSFISILKQYPVMIPDGDGFHLRTLGGGHWWYHHSFPFKKF